MAKLYFTYAAMNAGKSSTLLQAAHNYRERGMEVMLWTYHADPSSKDLDAAITSRIGLRETAHAFDRDTDFVERVKDYVGGQGLKVIFIDEAQFLSRTQVWQLASIVDELNIPILCYGLRSDFQGCAFEGAEVLLTIADELREARTICHCGRKATMNLRTDKDGVPLKSGEQVRLEKTQYVSLCRRHWREAFGAL